MLKTLATKGLRLCVNVCSLAGVNQQLYPPARHYVAYLPETTGFEKYTAIISITNSDSVGCLS